MNSLLIAKSAGWLEAGLPKEAIKKKAEYNECIRLFNSQSRVTYQLLQFKTNW